MRAIPQYQKLLNRWSAQRDDSGMTLIELLISLAVLLTLMTIVSIALTAYLSAGNTVITTYSSTDQQTFSQVVIQRLLRSQVEPADVQTQTSAPTCPTVGTAVVNAPCPSFATAAIGSWSTTFIANVGDANGPAKIVMSLGTPSKCAGCNYYSSVFSVVQYAACPYQTVDTTSTNGCPAFSGTNKNNVCPTATNLAAPINAVSSTQCIWQTTGKQLVTIPNVVNGGPTTGSTTLPYSSTPIFTYTTIDPYSQALVIGAGGTPSTSTGILPGFATCGAPTTNSNGIPTASNCPADMIQDVAVDLLVHAPGTKLSTASPNASGTVESAYTVYRLSSSSYLYSNLVG